MLSHACRLTGLVRSRLTRKERLRPTLTTITGMHVAIVMTLLFATGSKTPEVWDQGLDGCCRACPPVATRSHFPHFEKTAFLIKDVDGPDLPPSLLYFWKAFFESEKDGRILFARGPIEIVVVSQQEAVVSLKALLRCTLPL